MNFCGVAETIQQLIKFRKVSFVVKKNLGYIRNWSISNTPQYKMMPLRVQDFLKEIISYKSLMYFSYIFEFFGIF